MAKIPGEQYKLLRKLKDKGESVKIIKDWTIIDDLPNDYDITDLPHDTRFLVRCYEQGGSMTKTGKATIVCNSRGEELYPDFVYSHGHLSNGKHAKFLIENGVLVTSTKHGFIEIEQVVAEKDEDKVWLVINMIWEGRIEQLPDYYQEFTYACLAANEKANCFHCREPHFIKDNYEK